MPGRDNSWGVYVGVGVAWRDVGGRGTSSPERKDGAGQTGQDGCHSDPGALMELREFVENREAQGQGGANTIFPFLLSISESSCEKPTCPHPHVQLRPAIYTQSYASQNWLQKAGAHSVSINRERVKLTTRFSYDDGTLSSQERRRKSSLLWYGIVTKTYFK